MKLQSILPSILFAAVASLSFGAHAEDVEKKEKAQVENMMNRPHSHMEEKMGMAAKPKTGAPAADEKADAAPKTAKSEKKKAQKDSHFHPRDGGK